MWRCNLIPGKMPGTKVPGKFPAELGFIKLVPSLSDEVANLVILPTLHKGLCIVPVLRLVAVPELQAVAVVMPKVRTLNSLLAASEPDPIEWVPSLIPKLCKVLFCCKSHPFHSFRYHCLWVPRLWSAGGRLTWSMVT